MGSRLTFEFANDDAREHFKIWLCESGEQEYWMWMETREQEEDGDITVLEFDYHTEDGVLRTECGRLDER